MSNKVVLDDVYYAEQSKDPSLWVLRSVTLGLVGSYTSAGGPTWDGPMVDADKGRVAKLLAEKIG
jgi:hypothetical protein